MACPHQPRRRPKAGGVGEKTGVVPCDERPGPRRSGAPRRSGRQEPWARPRACGLRGAARANAEDSGSDGSRPEPSSAILRDAAGRRVSVAAGRTRSGGRASGRKRGPPRAATPAGMNEQPARGDQPRRGRNGRSSRGRLPHQGAAGKEGWGQARARALRPSRARSRRRPQGPLVRLFGSGRGSEERGTSAARSVHRRGGRAGGHEERRNAQSLVPRRRFTVVEGRAAVGKEDRRSHARVVLQVAGCRRAAAGAVRIP